MVDESITELIKVVYFESWAKYRPNWLSHVTQGVGGFREFKFLLFAAVFPFDLMITRRYHIIVLQSLFSMRESRLSFFIPKPQASLSPPLPPYLFLTPSLIAFSTAARQLLVMCDKSLRTKYFPSERKAQASKYNNKRLRKFAIMNILWAFCLSPECECRTTKQISW